MDSTAIADSVAKGMGLGVGLGMGLALFLVILAALGLLIGALARLILPGPDPMSIPATMGFQVLPKSAVLKRNGSRLSTWWRSTAM